jgi:hypothetical protein
MPVGHYDWTKLSQKSLAHNKGFYVPLVSLYNKIYIKKWPGLQLITVYRMSLVLHPQFKFPDNTFKLKMICTVRTYSQVKKLPIVL